MQDEHSARCIFAQMPAISIWAAVQLSRSSIIHELCSTDTTLVSSPCSGPGQIALLHRRAIELTPRRDVRSANEPDLLRKAPLTKPAHAARAPTLIRDWSRFDRTIAQDLVEFQPFLISIFCCFFAISADFGK